MEFFDSNFLEIQNRMSKDNSAIFLSYPERKEYLNYKSNSLKNINFSNKLKYKILEILEQLGFSPDSLGFYYYKDVIVRIIKRLEWLDTDGYYFILGETNPELLEKLSTSQLEIYIKQNLNGYLEYLKEELNNPYSQFYFDIARNDNDISTKRFHEYIRKCFEEFDFEKNSLSLNYQNHENAKVNYGEFAFLIAEYVRELDFYKNTTDKKETLKPMMRIKNVVIN